MTWTAVLIAGIYWILSAPDVNNIVRSTVSIAFVTNIDEMVYGLTCPTPIKRGLVSTKYLLKHRAIWLGLPEKHIYFLTYKYGAYVHLPLIFILPFISVVLLRTQPIVAECAKINPNFWSTFVSECPWCDN